MPIKFRCQQCRQFLGISRAKAGQVVDCPTCGRTIRVPDLDGTVKPLPRPGLDMQDSSLARALNEIASIGGDPADDDDNVEEFESAAVSDSDDELGRFQASPPDDDGAKQSGQSQPPGPEVVELEPLPPPEPVELAPAGNQRRELPPAADFDDDDSADRGWRSTRQGGDSWKRLLAAAELEGDSHVAPVKTDDPEPPPAAAPSGGTPAVAAPVTAPASEPGVVRLAPSTWIALAGIAAVIFAAGFWAGRMTTLQNGTRETVGTQTGEGDAGPHSTGAAEPEDDRTPAIRGRITWRTESGEVRADVGARIIVLPVERDGSSLIPSAGIQTDSEAVDRELTSTMIRKLGGDFQTTDDSGEFSIQLPNAGRFHLLVLSNALPRDDGTDIADIESVVGRYFDRPPVVLGRVQLHLDEVQYSGAGTTPWDHSFQRS